MKLRLVGIVTSIALLCFIANVASAAVVLTYQFNNSFAADQSTSATLTPVVGPNVSSTIPSAFVSDNVVLNGVSQARTVWNFNGDDRGVPNQQVGLSLNTAGVVPSTAYSVEIVFNFTGAQNVWRRIMDDGDLLSDSGVYIDPGNTLDVFPVSGSANAFTVPDYHEVVMTTDGTTVKGYLDGSLQLSINTALLNIPASNIVSFFLDNTASAPQNEYSPGNVALVQFYDTVLAADDVREIFDNPLPVQGGDGTAAPEPLPISVMLVIGAIWSGGYLVQKRRKQIAA